MSMTDEEKAQLQRSLEIAEKLNAALFHPSADGQPPMMDRISVIVVGAERGSWAVKWATRIMLGLGAVVGAIVTIKSGISK